MDTELYTKLKHCWKKGYKLPKIKEYCETDYSLDDLQELFMEMWENELEAYKYVKAMTGVDDSSTTIGEDNNTLHNRVSSYKSGCDRALLSRVNSLFAATKLTNEEFKSRWLNDLFAEDQAMGLYEDPRYKDHTDSQIADLYNFMDASFRCVGITHWQDNKGDKV